MQSAKGFKDISGAIGTISGAAGDAAGKLSEMFDAMGNTAVKDALGGVQQVMNAVSNIGQGFAKGGIVGGIAAAVGEAANFIGQAFAANQRHKEALKQVMNEAIAQQREYNLLLMQQNLLYEKATTIFGTDAYSKAANSVNVMKDAISELNEALKGTSEQQERQKQHHTAREDDQANLIPFLQSGFPMPVQQNCGHDKENHDGDMQHCNKPEQSVIDAGIGDTVLPTNHYKAERQQNQGGKNQDQ